MLELSSDKIVKQNQLDEHVYRLRKILKEIDDKILRKTKIAYKYEIPTNSVSTNLKCCNATKTFIDL